MSVNDPVRSRQWGLTALDAEAVWARSQGAGVTVAVVDTGVDPSNSDLAGKVLPGWDVVTDKPAGDHDSTGHGTEVAGVIAATANNGRGIAGLAPKATILPVRVTDQAGNTSNVYLAEGIVWAVDHGAQVVNVSMGTPFHSPGLDQAVAYATAHNVVVVASAGNKGLTGNPVQYPGASPGAIAVGATDTDGSAAAFSTAGSYVGVAAPGVNIWTTVPGAFIPDTGTSFAAPFVSAEAALLVAVEGDGYTVAGITHQIESTAKDIGAAGKDDRTGYGQIVPVDALTLALGQRLASTTKLSVPSTVAVVGHTLTMSGRLTTSHGAFLAHRPVTVTAKGGGTTQRRSVTTSSTGRFTASFTALARTTLTVSYAGDATTKAMTSPATVARVAAALSLKKSRHSLKVKATRGVTVRLQKRSHGHWVTTSHWKASGGWRTVKLKAATHRVVTVATSSYAARSSAAWTTH